MSVLKDPEGNEAKHLQRFAKPAGRRVLEVGCGDGRLTWRYARESSRVTAIDLDRPGLRVATIERPADLQQRVAFLQANSMALPFRNDSFDLAIFAWSF